MRMLILVITIMFFMAIPTSANIAIDVVVLFKSFPPPVVVVTYQQYRVSDGVGGWENYRVSDGAAGWENYMVAE